MTTVDFLRRILPRSGYYVIARFVNAKAKPIHQVCASIEEAAQYALNCDSQGVTAFHACASFREAEVKVKGKNGGEYSAVRIQTNVKALRSFFLDCDIKPGLDMAFASQEAALDALVEFCGKTLLPIPTAVSSGVGLHLYFTLTDEISKDQWQPVAEGLKALCAHHKFYADPACTSDAARILRPVGTHNRKDPANPRLVEIIHEAPDVDFAEFSSTVTAALRAVGIKPVDTIRKRETAAESVNADFQIKRDWPASSAHKVADRCQQFRKFRDTKGNIPEPLWHASLQLAACTVEGAALAHEWSSGHPGYDAGETDTKLARVTGMGPTLCRTFESRNPGGCDGCPFKDKISSPAQLGAVMETAPAPVIETVVGEQTITRELVNPPAPFRRDDTGIYMEDDGVLHRIYEYDCYPTDIVFDEALGYEVTLWRHFLPHDGWKQHAIKSSLLAKPSDFEVAIRDIGIQPLQKQRFLMYGDSYLRTLRAAQATRQLFKSMGWKKDNEVFVLGDRAYSRDGPMIQAGHSHRVGGFLSAFTQKGTLDDWKALCDIFKAAPDALAPHLFMLLIGFAAPLLHLSGRTGFTVSALGKSGNGKSTMGRWIASIYGHPDETWASRETTMNALIERIGAYHSLPAYMDEVTTLEPKALRDLVYMIATGKGKDSLTRDRVPRPTVNWKTVLICSTNDSLQAKLQMENQAAEAELMRLLEFEFPKEEFFISMADDVIHDVLNNNYGVAGGVYIEYVIKNQASIIPRIEQAIRDTRVALDMDAKERFWIWAAALALLGGRLAVEAGVLDVDPDSVLPWLYKETGRMREDIQMSQLSATEVLGQFLDLHIGERLVMASKVNADFAATGSKPNRGALSQRYERDIEKLWIDKHRIETWLKRNHFNHKQIRDELMAQGVLENYRDMKKLGAFTDLAGKSVACWRIAMNHEAMKRDEKEAA